VITRRGRPVALLAPYQAPGSRERELAIEHIVALMREGLPIGGHRFTRDEMHERG
jgi:antitoxin (DNA-binding transcriptional repressor) of toxin-antitoxin stability system